MFDKSRLSVSVIFAAVSVSVLSQNDITSFIKLFENSSSFPYQLLRNSSSWFPIEGSKSNLRPLGITFPSRHFAKKSL